MEAENKNYWLMISWLYDVVSTSGLSRTTGAVMLRDYGIVSDSLQVYSLYPYIMF